MPHFQGLPFQPHCPKALPSSPLCSSLLACASVPLPVLCSGCFQRHLFCLGSDGGLAHLGITAWYLRTSLNPLIGFNTTLARVQIIMLASQECKTGRQQGKEMRSWHFDSFLYFAVWKAHLVFHPSGWGGEWRGLWTGLERLEEAPCPHSSGVPSPRVLSPSSLSAARPLPMCCVSGLSWRPKVPRVDLQACGLG